MKYLLPRITSLLFLAFISHTTYSQVNFKQGYVITLAGDTIHGFIDYRNWAANPEKISFKENSDSKNVYYTPLDIRSFSVLDELYESAIVETEISPSNIQNLDFGSELKLETDTAFLQAMIIGEISLYYYFNSYGNSQFYVKTDSLLELLAYKKYTKIVKVENTTLETKATKILENTRYIGQLMHYLNDCPNIKSMIENTKYTKKSMLELFDYYYNCTHSKLDFKKSTEKARTEFGIVVGLSLTSLSFNGSIRPDLYDADFQPSTNFSAGLSLNLVIPRTNSKWSIYNELAFSSYMVDGHHLNYDNANKYTVTKTSIGYSYLKMVNMARFIYPINHFSFFLNAGLSNGFGFNETNYQQQEITLYTTYRVEEVKALMETRKFEYGYLLGVGSKYRRYSFEFRYEIGFGMSEYINLEAKTRKLFFLFGYNF